MSDFYVTKKDVEPVVSVQEKELIQALPADKEIENRFPFDDPYRNKIEVFKVGTQDECKQFIDRMNDKIISFFKVEKF